MNLSGILAFLKSVGILDLLTKLWAFLTGQKTEKIKKEVKAILKEAVHKRSLKAANKRISK